MIVVLDYQKRGEDYWERGVPLNLCTMHHATIKDAALQAYCGIADKSIIPLSIKSDGVLIWESDVLRSEDYQQLELWALDGGFPDGIYIKRDFHLYEALRT